MNKINEIPDDIPMDEILKKVDESFDFMDAERARGLEKLKSIQRIKNRASHRERVRLVDKYGSDHVKVKSIDRRLRYNTGAINELNSEIERVSTVTPLIDKNTWMIHGHVVNDSNVGIEGLTVSLFDENQNWLKELGYACTNDKGYFAIKYIVEEEETPTVPEDQAVILTVSDKDHKIIHQEEEALFVILRKINYRFIVIPETDQVCTPPQADEGNGGEMPVPPDVWIVRGTVLDKNEQGIQGLTVSLYDKDLFFDDALGTTTTGEKGGFYIMYKTEDFKDLFEKRPDIYLKILDEKGKTLYDSKKAVRCDAGREEIFPAIILK